METKILEIRDEGTMIPVLCVDMNPEVSLSALAAKQRETTTIIEAGERYKAQFWHLRRCGYSCNGQPNIGMTHLSMNGTPASNDPFAWGGGRTRQIAHHYIIENWTALKDGDVVDVQFILGETKEKKISERFTT